MADIKEFVNLGFADFASVEISEDHKNLAEWSDALQLTQAK